MVGRGARTARARSATWSTNRTAFQRAGSSRNAADGTMRPSHPALRNRRAASRHRRPSRNHLGSSAIPAAVRAGERRRSTAVMSSSSTCQRLSRLAPWSQCLPTSARATPTSPARYRVGSPAALHRFVSRVTRLEISRLSVVGPEHTAVALNGATRAMAFTPKSRPSAAPAWRRSRLAPHRDAYRRGALLRSDTRRGPFGCLWLCRVLLVTAASATKATGFRLASVSQWQRRGLEARGQ